MRATLGFAPLTTSLRMQAPGRVRTQDRQETEETSMHLSHADHGSSPPRVEIPRDYNAAHDLLQRNAARPDKVAYIDASSGERLTYAQLSEQAHRFANALRQRGITPETRVMLAMLDTLE